MRGPEIEAITSVVQSGRAVSLESLISKFVPPDEGDQPRKTDLLREALNFLRTIEIVQQKTDAVEGVTLHIVDDDGSEPFSLRLLRRLQSFDDDRRAFRLITDLVAGKNLLFASRNNIVRDLEVAYSGSYSWNVEKLQTWMHLADYTGLVRSIKSDQGDIMACPQPALLHKLLAIYRSSKGVTDKVPIGDWLSFVHRTYFSCFTSSNDVHVGLSRSLKAMSTMGQLAFDMLSDASSAVRLEEQRVAYLIIPSQVK